VIKAKPKRVLYRIILPFTLLIILVASLSWYFSASFITRHMDQSLIQQMHQVAAAISKSSYLLNPAVLQQVKAVIDAEVVVFDREGRILSATGSKRSFQAGCLRIDKPSAEDPISGSDVLIDGIRYRTVVHPVPLPEQGRAFLSLWKPTAETDRLKRRIVLGMGGISLLGILAMAAIGFVIARSITAPVEELLTTTEKVAEGQMDVQARVSGGDEIGRLAVSFNNMIVRLKAFEQQRVESEKLAAADQMVAGFVHEVRNPMTSIKMLAQVLHGRLKDRPDDQEMLGSLVNEINRLDRIIQEMIHRTRPGELQREWRNLNKQVEDVVQLARQSLAESQIPIASQLAESSPEIYVDAEKIKQVLWNLILNARDAMPDGGSIAVATREIGETQIELIVEDSGPGVSEIDPERLFQPFFTTKPEGVGLGLPISRKIVEQHGGTLRLENRPEGGARATVVLPVKTDNQTDLS